MGKFGKSVKSASDAAKLGMAAAKATTEIAGVAAREQTTKAYESGRRVAARGIDTSKDLAARAMIKSGDTFDKNPLAVVLGGIALGVIIGALIPDTEREKRLIGKAGKRLTEKAGKMAEAAKDAGKIQIDNLGFNSETIREQVRALASKGAEALRAAGQAVSDEARKKD